jgi:hypothetical protein
MQKRVCGDHLVVMIDPANDEEESWRSLGDHDHSRGNEAQILQGVRIIILFHQHTGIRNTVSNYFQVPSVRPDWICRRLILENSTLADFLIK